ncbi:MAG: hypothetical protein HC828_14905 [Blastochloris sp.]|nr:hypothetical protein [Blastochloris sp.]
MLGWLPDSLALDSDLTWANLAGKPAPLTAALANQSANTVWAGPASGAAAAPAFRTLTSADVPPLDAGKITSGVFSPARGGTGVANTGTLTVNAPTAITGGGTIELEGATVTAVESGTLVLGAGSGGRVAFWLNESTVTSSNEFRFSVSSGLYARATNAQNACRIESVNTGNPTDIYTLSTRFNNTGARQPYVLTTFGSTTMRQAETSPTCRATMLRSIIVGRDGLECRLYYGLGQPHGWECRIVEDDRPGAAGQERGGNTRYALRDLLGQHDSWVCELCNLYQQRAATLW